MAVESIDHVMIAVRDLEAATRTYADLLGLVATGGGDHPGRGTRNRIIVLDACYLELIALQPDAPADHWLARFLARGEGLVRVALATADLPATVDGLRAGGADLHGPVPGQLVAPDGASRGWQTAFAGGGDFETWQLPFLIEHDSAGAERRRRLAHPHAPAAHPLGARDMPAAVVAVTGLTAGIATYQRTFGLPGEPPGEDEMLDARTARLALRDAALILAAPRHEGTGPISRGLAARGEGLYCITLTVDDLQGAVNGLRGRGAHVRVHEPDDVLVAAQLDPAQTCGARIELVAAPTP
jgi:catechol 2,3-dioxygenase-like lactoylglutathione lyase family enzyme